MNIKRTSSAIALAALVFAGNALAKPEPPVTVDTSGLPPHVAKRVEEKARLGMTQLRLYMQRTRMIHGLYFARVIRDDSPAPARGR